MDLPSLQDLLDAKPVLSVQLVDLFLAMTVVLVFMKIGAKVLWFTFKSVARISKAKELEMRLILSGKKPDMYDPESEFQEFCAKTGKGVDDFASWRERKVQEIAKADNKTNATAANSLLHDKHSIDAYVDESSANLEAMIDFACYRGSNNMMLFLQHGLAGLLGVVALCQSEHAQFAKYARWGMFFEAGWELSDWFFFIIPNIAKGKAATAIPMMIHHMCLYGLLPVNLYCMDGPMGRDLAWALVVMAGMICPICLIGFCCELLDQKHRPERVLGKALCILLVLILWISRGPLWWWLGYNFVTKSKPLGTGIHVLFVILAILFQLFNIIFYVMGAGILKEVLSDKNDGDEDAARIAYEHTLHALLNPIPFQRVHQKMGKTHWTQVRAAHKLHMLKLPKKPAEKKDQ